MFCLSLKQTYPGSCIGLPRIIGGSDLAIYQCTERLDKDEWFLEAREVRHQIVKSICKVVLDLPLSCIE